MKFCKLKFLFVAALSMIPAAAEAARERKLCPQPEDFIQEVYNCGQNEVAVSYAKACAEASLATTRAQGKILHAAMELMRKEIGKAQNQNMVDVQKRLFMAANNLGTQITALQKSTELVAGYTAPMIDFSDCVDDESSAECFSTAFHALQNIVDAMDKEILNSKHARDAAIAMLGSLQGREHQLDSITPATPPAAVGAAPQPGQRGPLAPAPDGRKIRNSDVSGTEKVKKK